MESSLSQRSGLFTTVVVIHALALWIAATHVSKQEQIEPPVVLMASLISPDRPEPVVVKPKTTPQQPVQPQVAAPPPVATTTVAAPAEYKVPEPVVVPKTVTEPAPQPTPVVMPVVAVAPKPVAVKPEPEEAMEPVQYKAEHLHNPKPMYPLIAKRLGQEGLVILKVYVSTDGSPQDVKVAQSSGFAKLDTAAAQTVKERWKFIPAKKGKTPYALWVDVPIRFSLKDEEVSL